ncbi:YtxH domain-containing protein [Paenisporosarcina indica]|uniref:YtxH domain-containing protein n=1 Tax=Paenisporosarcina indica TaxID=650093 RepID=UPI0009500C0F|nr:YtxH domain-containing protein [Paenisporosarcina indica]
MTQQKPNYNDEKYNQEFYTNNSTQTEAYLPQPYEYLNGHPRDPIYTNDEVNSKDFLIGALVGGIIGAAAALFLAPKSGAELRGDVSIQALQLKDKTVDLSSTAREKTAQLSTQIKEKSGPIVDKVKSIKSKTPSLMDDGTVSSEGEEPIDFLETVSNTLDEVTNDETTSTAEALKEAVADIKN